MSASVKFSVFASFQLQDMHKHKILRDDLTRIFKRVFYGPGYIRIMERYLFKNIDLGDSPQR